MTTGLFDDPPRSVAFRVYAKPEPKGSFRAIMVHGRPTPIPDNAKSKRWEKAVRLVATRVCAEHEWLPFDCPCLVEMVFTMAKPKKPRWGVPAVKPDWDKLARSTGDALSKIAYVDDARVVQARVILRYASETEPEGVHIVVKEVRGD